MYACDASDMEYEWSEIDAIRAADKEERLDTEADQIEERDAE